MFSGLNILTQPNRTIPRQRQEHNAVQSRVPFAPGGPLLCELGPATLRQKWVPFVQDWPRQSFALVLPRESGALPEARCQSNGLAPLLVMLGRLAVWAEGC